MCGIAGIVARDCLLLDERLAVTRMSERLAHRGPDGRGHYFDLHAGLAHRRLAVTDVEGGRQPLSNEDGSIWVLLNGQIYNHRELRGELESRGHTFATRSDTETIVHLYEEAGDACLDRLNGMFAIAIWDARQRRLVLARDRLGVKPLYYSVDDRRIMFGSELKAIVAAELPARDLDVTALADYLAFGFVPSPKTIYRGVKKLEPGEVLVFSPERTTRSTWWSPAWNGWATEPAEELEERLWQHLGEATQARLHADVPVGALLSGGLDSSAVLCAAAESRGGVAGDFLTFSVGYDDGHCEEKAAAQAMATRLGSQHRDCVAGAPSAGQLERLAWHFDEPFADPSALPLMILSRIARPHITVALTGDGGDEALAGYRRYVFDVREEAVRQNTPRWVRRRLVGTAARLYPDGAWLPRPLRARTTLGNLAVDGATAHARSIARMGTADVRRVLHPDVVEALGDYDPLERVRSLYQQCDAPHHLARCQFVDIRFGLADGILTKVDRAAMASALEVRSPLLDHRLVQFALSIPPELRMRRGRGKHLLREAIRKRLGDGAADRPKTGFGVPLDSWFRRVDAATRRGSVTGFVDWRSAQDAMSAMLNLEAVADLRTAHLGGRRNLGPTLWSIEMLAAWASQEERCTETMVHRFGGEISGGDARPAAMAGACR